MAAPASHLPLLLVPAQGPAAGSPALVQILPLTSAHVDTEPGMEVESHVYIQTLPSKRSHSKATALPVRTAVVKENIPERFVSRASKL